MPPEHIDGRRLGRRLKKLSITRRAMLACDLECGVPVQNFTAGQASMLAKVPACYVRALRRASDEERRALERGSLSLSALQHRPRPITDAELERVVVKVGPDRVMRVLDKLTAPVPLVAAE
jgi:hypothetical protein